jgi:iron complex transport system substrate-binding protein
VEQLARIVAAIARGEKLPPPRPGDLRAAPLPVEGGPEDE